MERWNPPVELSKKEQLIMKRLNRVRALFGFLRTKRHILFDDAFQEQLEGMYRQTGAGDPPHPPAWLCMVLLLQGYVGASDAEKRPFPTSTSISPSTAADAPRVLARSTSIVTSRPHDGTLTAPRPPALILVLLACVPAVRAHQRA